MLFERYYDETLAQASYLVGCEATREAIVIDPNRDVEAYVRAAHARRMRIRVVTETHIHADFLSGARALAEATGATLMLSGDSTPDWRYGFATEDTRLVHDGDTIDVGQVRLTVMHAPGHTPEQVVFLVTDRATGDRPLGLLSGDFLFVGDVGRPDLLEKAAHIAGSMETAARQLYRSLQRTAELPDYLQIWPGHGAGSACGKSLGAVPQTTLGYERMYNPALQQKSESDFVRWVLSDQPEPPPYFAEMKRLNKDGPPPPPSPANVRELSVSELDDALHDGGWVIDVRSSADFARGHVTGTINIPSSNSLATYAGTVLSYDRPIILIAKGADQAAKAARQLALIGMDRVTGWIPFSAIDGRTMAPSRLIDAPALARALENGSAPHIIDVRGRSEWNHEHLAAAEHIYLGDLVARTASMPRDDAIVVLCQSGTRSSIAASLLLAHGFANVSNFSGGVDAWRKAGLPLIDEHA
ncbi:MAG TPA: rhodanese-like domain-containing protein [Gemmatimonadaceae bacterium]|nr:rhodanese-like domain-containing protein [Gemmatimonadaceae bacterium]